MRVRIPEVLIQDLLKAKGTCDNVRLLEAHVVDQDDGRKLELTVTSDDFDDVPALGHIPVVEIDT
jgi:hypothetical protein